MDILVAVQKKNNEINGVQNPTSSLTQLRALSWEPWLISNLKSRREGKAAGFL